MRKVLLTTTVLFISLFVAGCNLVPSSSNSGSGSGNGNGTGNGTGNGNGTGGNQENTNTNTVKPAGWPTDIATAEGGFEYTYARIADTYYLGYKVKLNGKTVQQLHADLVNGYKAAGWSNDDNSILESDTGVFENFVKGDYTMTTTTAAESGDDFATIAIISGKKTE